ncbi:MAG: YhfC family glutamic-type intramembrane protease [Chloroflexota bacterium]
MDALHLLSGAGMIVAALATVVYWKVRSNIPWILFLWGALAWIVGVTLKAVASIPSQTIINGVRDILPRYLSEPVLWIYIGLLTGIFEGGAALGFAFIRKIRTASWREVIGFGLGFGALEAFLLGVVAFVLVLLIILAPDKLPPELLQLVTEGDDSLLAIPAPIIERITAILIHAFSCLLIVYAVQVKAWKWFWVSFFYKTAVDSIAGFIHLTYGVENLTTLGVWVMEFSLLPFGIVGGWGLWAFQRKWPSVA